MWPQQRLSPFLAAEYSTRTARSPSRSFESVGPSLKSIYGSLQIGHSGASPFVRLCLSGVVKSTKPGTGALYAVLVGCVVIVRMPSRRAQDWQQRTPV
jgi:hypothetical protein